MMSPNQEWQEFATLVSDRMTKLVTGIVVDAKVLRNKAECQDAAELLQDFDRIISSSHKLETMIKECHQYLNNDEKNLEKSRADFRHDLRTPINAIKGYGQLMMEELEDRDIDVLNDGLNRLVANAQRLEQEVNQLSGNNETVEPSPVGDKESKAASTSISGFRVFVIDDDEGSRDFISRLLQRRGSDVRTASSGAEALNKLSREGADLILLDMVMHGMDGLGVLRLLKGHSQLKAIPVIMVSGVDDNTPLIECLEAGAEAFLKKPISFDDLMNVMVKRKNKPAKTSTRTLSPNDRESRIIDHSRIEAIGSDLGHDILLELINDFHRVSAGHADDIQHAAINDDMEAWGRSAHSFKSAARTMGLERLSGICRGIEYACDQGSPDDAVRFTAMIDDHLYEALAELDKLCRKIPPLLSDRGGAAGE